MSNIQQGINQLFDIGAIASGGWERYIRENTPKAPADYIPDPANKGVIGAKREAKRIAELRAGPKIPQLTAGPSDLMEFDPEREYQRQLEMEQQTASYRQYKDAESMENKPIYVPFSETKATKAMERVSKIGTGSAQQNESVRRLLAIQRGERVQKLMQKEGKNG